MENVSHDGLSFLQQVKNKGKGNKGKSVKKLCDKNGNNKLHGKNKSVLSIKTIQNINYLSASVCNTNNNISHNNSKWKQKYSLKSTIYKNTPTNSTKNTNLSNSNKILRKSTTTFKNIQSFRNIEYSHLNNNTNIHINDSKY